MKKNKPTCTEEGCENRAIMRGLCVKHHATRKAAGTLPPKRVGAHRQQPATPKTHAKPKPEPEIDVDDIVETEPVPKPALPLKDLIAEVVRGVEKVVNERDLAVKELRAMYKLLREGVPN